MMMDNNFQSDPRRFLLNAVLLLSGVVLVLLKAYVPQEAFKDLLQALGTALFAVGFVGILLQRLQVPKKNTVEIATHSRSKLAEEYKTGKYKAKKVDIASIALSGALNEIASDAHDRFLKRVLLENLRSRLIFLSPKSGYVLQRALEDGKQPHELTKILSESVREVRRIYEKLADMHEDAVRGGGINSNMVGSLEIRVMDHCPHFTLYRTDDQILWGMYTSNTRGINSAVLRVGDNNRELFTQLMKHFDTLWMRSIDGQESNTLLRYHDNSGPPTYNEELERFILEN